MVVMETNGMSILPFPIKRSLSWVLADLGGGHIVAETECLAPFSVVLSWVSVLRRDFAMPLVLFSLLSLSLQLKYSCLFVVLVLFCGRDEHQAVNDLADVTPMHL